jgi:hypothetical protein
LQHTRDEAETTREQLKQQLGLAQRGFVLNEMQKRFDGALHARHREVHEPIDRVARYSAVNQ